MDLLRESMVHSVYLDQRREPAKAAPVVPVGTAFHWLWPASGIHAELVKHYQILAVPNDWRTSFLSKLH